MIDPEISGDTGLPDFTPMLFVNLPELNLLCSLGVVTAPLRPLRPCKQRWQQNIVQSYFINLLQVVHFDCVQYSS